MLIRLAEINDARTPLVIDDYVVRFKVAVTYAEAVEVDEDQPYPVAIRRCERSSIPKFAGSPKRDRMVEPLAAQTYSAIRGE